MTQRITGNWRRESSDRITAVNRLGNLEYYFDKNGFEQKNVYLETSVIVSDDAEVYSAKHDGGTTGMAERILAKIAGHRGLSDFIYGSHYIGPQYEYRGHFTVRVPGALLVTFENNDKSKGYVTIRVSTPKSFIEKDKSEEGSTKELVITLDSHSMNLSESELVKIAREK